jgi:hypothetical protein
VYRTAGWVSPTILAAGRVVGTWEHRVEEDHLEVRLTPFEDLGSSVRTLVEAEAERLAAYFERPLSLYT